MEAEHGTACLLVLCTVGNVFLKTPEIHERFVGSRFFSHTEAELNLNRDSVKLFKGLKLLVCMGGGLLSYLRQFAFSQRR